MKPNNTQLTNAVAVVLTALIFVLFWKVVLPNYSEKRNTLNVVRSETVAAKEKLDSLNTAKLDMDEISGVVEEFLVSVSDSPDEPNIISEIEAIGAKNGLSIPSIGVDYADSAQNAMSDLQSAELFSNSSSTSKINPVQISFSVVGQFDQLSSFLESLENSLKFMEVESLNYAISDEGDIAMAVSAKAFYRE